MSNYSELLVCPFCGGEAKIKRNKTVMVSCGKCSACTFQKLHDPDSALRDWQARAALVAPQQEPVAVTTPIQMNALESAGKSSAMWHPSLASAFVNVPLYAAPPSVAPLTDEQILSTCEDFVKEPGWFEFEKSDFVACVRAIIAQARGEK